MRKKSEKKGIGVLVISLFFVAVILIFGSLRFYEAFEKREWYGKSVFVVFNSHELTIEVYEPSAEKIQTYILPKKSYVEVPSGYGFYKIEDVAELSVVEGRGETLLAQSISNTFGIPFDTTTETINDWDRIMVWYARTMYEDRDGSVDLAAAPIFVEEERIDGEKLEKVDPDRVDRFFKHDLWEKTITDENLSVGIFNSSAEPNIALTISRKLERIGIHVTEVDNLTEKIDSACEMRVKEDKRDSYTTKRLERLFDCRVSDTAPHPRFDIMMVTSEPI
jgi:hypothetical protein